ncbi:hypothetical protein ACI78T_03815 [Blastococcus sp. SYSU D00922]
MTPVPSSPAPGSMTVPPLFGWEVILVVLVGVVLVGVLFLVLGAARASGSERSEFQAWLDGRSGSRAGEDAGRD